MIRSPMSLREDETKWRENSCRKNSYRRRNAMTAEEAERAWLVRVMWRAFPEATSETDLARRVADYLTKGGKPVDRRTVRYWLRQETAPGWGYIVELLALAGVEAVTEFFFGTGDRGRMQ